MSGYLLVDGNSIGHAAHNTPVLTTGGMQTQAIIQFLKMLKTARVRHQELTNVVVLWDGRAQWRYDLYPEYKGKRKEDPKKVESKIQYEKQVPHIKRGLKVLGIEQLVSPDFEADDLAGFMTRRIEKSNQRVALISGDTDWLQLVSGRVSWCDPRVKPVRQINRINFQQESGYQSGVQLLQAKALKGDTSDSISGVGGIGEKTADDIIRHFGSVPKLVAAYRDKEGGFGKTDLPEELSRARNKINAFCAEGLPIFKRNMILMNLNSDTHDAAIGKSLQRDSGAQDWNAFSDFCRELSFMSIINSMDEWKNVFSKTRAAA